MQVAAKHAWVDESMYLNGAQSFYITAATICNPSEAHGVREGMRPLLMHRQTRLHWHGESPTRRTRIVETIAGLEVTSIVVIGSPLLASKQERARRKCLEGLFLQLAQLGVSPVWLESRTQSLNRYDQKTVQTLRGNRVLPASLRVEIALPTSEPMLWVPDAVAGAVNASRRGKTRWFDPLRPKVEIVEIAV